MNFDKITVILKKISRLIETLKEADIEVSAIEKELILTYIKELQAEVGVATAEKVGRKILSDAQPVKKEEAPEASQKEEDIANEEDTFSTIEEDERLHDFPAEEDEEGEEDEEEDEVLDEVDDDTEEEVESYPDELEALFEVKAGSELSDKLSLSPIKDLRKSMGVNERIFTINELFDGDQRLFDEVILHLNNLSSFEGASEYLKKKVAGENEWENKQKKKKAEHFIRLIYRRYL